MYPGLSLGQVQGGADGCSCHVVPCLEGSKPTGEVTRASGTGQKSDTSPQKTQAAGRSRGSAIEWPAPFPRRSESEALTEKPAEGWKDG